MSEASDLAIRQRAWHQSSVKELTEGCSWKWKLRYIDGLDDPSGWAALVGTSVHAAVEAHEQERIDARVERRRLRAVSEDEMVAAAHRYLEVRDVGPQRDYGDGRPYDLATAKHAIGLAVGHWWHGVIPDGQPGGGGTIRDRLLGWTPVAVEPHFRTWLPDLSKPIGGWIDGVYRLPDGSFRVTDSKTASNYGRWPTDGTVSRLQPAQYGLGALLSTGLPVWGKLPTFEFQIMRTSAAKNARFEPVRVIAVDLDDLDVQWVTGRVAAAEQVVQSGGYTPRPDSPLCSERWCAFYEAPGSPCPARPHPGEGPSHAELVSIGAAPHVADPEADDPFDGVALPHDDDMPF